MSLEGFPGDSVVKKYTCQCRRHGFNLWIGEIPWRMRWQPTLVFLPGKSHGQRSLAGYNPRGRKRVRYYWATKQIKSREYCGFPQMTAMLSSQSGLTGAQAWESKNLNSWAPSLSTSYVIWYSIYLWKMIHNVCDYLKTQDVLALEADEPQKSY